ncbi:uncharacterized protein LOC105214795 [Zeugodacus cucurbitae]|uniref:uncharacterized protein LOC105214795 n=1 Tax=Zeugodacus cucurbitae TaxID=28588 RepID=UPI0023D8F3A3|nr:uncharacterized protein LOC105214795 [Zeugodacus cucurbitae]XP_054082721.1 uncharacterized protein LOC105214795 [Zeugodacus cucurbitae]XP_054082722.1 uncharacterized protein LOC105214795 [Zeugodacus cucurbitae]
MPSDTQNCSPKPIFKGLTKLFLKAFGTKKLPAGYVKGDGYGPKTKKQHFAKLFTQFYILILLAIICVFAFLLMIILLLWYCNRDKYKSEPCRNPKLCTRLLTSLLLLSLILLALFLFITFNNLLHLNKLYNKSNNESRTSDGGIIKDVNEILGKDFRDLTNTSLFKCRRSPSLTDVYPETTKARKVSIADRQMFEHFRTTSIDPIFPNILLYDDLFRMFSRNFSAFYAPLEFGKSLVSKTKSTLYNDQIFSLHKWGELYHSASAIKYLMNYYKDTARSDEVRSHVCNLIRKYFTTLASYAKVQKSYLNRKIETYYLSRDSVIAPPYIFGQIVCIMAIVILVVFLLFLMCTLCMKGHIMIKALLFIFIILTLLLILMSFVTFYHFFYGVIEYNGFCRIRGNSTRKDSFNHVMLTECTNDQNLYTLLSKHNLIVPFSKWIDLNGTNIMKTCKDTCRPLNMSMLQELRPKVQGFPISNQFCKFKPVTSTWIIYIRLSHMYYASKKNRYYMIDGNPALTYYYKRVNSTLCLLDLARQAYNFRPSVNRTQYLKCRAAYKVGKDFHTVFPNSITEAGTMCDKTTSKCKDFHDQNIPKIVADVTKYKENAEVRLKKALGSCANVLPIVTTKQKKSCDCETYILNGVWVGGLLFVLTLLLALLLLTCLICKLERCRDPYGDGRRRGRRSLGRLHDASAESILLPAITLPRRVIDSLEDDENPSVTYHVKKLN